MLDSLRLSFTLVTKMMRITRADRALLLEHTVIFCQKPSARMHHRVTVVGYVCVPGSIVFHTVMNRPRRPSNCHSSEKDLNTTCFWDIVFRNRFLYGFMFVYMYISVKMAAPWVFVTLLSYYSLCRDLRSH